ncbi:MULTISPECIES: helix-turn-helix domain-containing protein [Rodentibacter]|uniref:Transcriptional regulator n=3 Tax=Rodentibacter TaxID=1960084 RepID=A0A1V3IG98_9PAST|nr:MULTISPECIES: helix-turn-helix domain-containing protein [Rodentibacter]OOF36457.1 transcriptional regulator [Rodentibacter heidelbergensis]OOF39407.1 transcriptional regulator [Rodentibacter rarus]OOF41027.1 transcriptional regulator [Rodentibacter rarus]OOF45977.1 transcriptional regulator [Rodentibacter trehalosifermentans]OOF47459.1 transcriptional regulator [Rodentibacter trehalosifermentans]
MKINEKIRQLREQHQLSQENMADKLGMSVTGYAKIERGEVRSTLQRLEQISEVFEMDICELFAFGENEKIYFNNSVVESTNSNNFLFAVGNENLEKAIQQLQLMLTHKDELLLQKDKIIHGLERELELLRKLQN